MRWWLFVPVMALALAVDQSFMPALAFGSHVPRLWPVVLAFAALHASRGAAIWASLGTGLWLDAMLPALGAGIDAPRAVPVLGPHVLACAAGVLAVLELRTWLWRRNTVAVAFAALAMLAFVSLAFIAIAGIRAIYADPTPLWGGGSGATALVSDLLDALLTAAVGLVPAWGLQATIPAWDFAMAGPRFGIPGRSRRPGD